MKTLIELAKSLTSSIGLTEEEILKLVYDQASTLMDTDNMYIALYDDIKDVIRFPLAFQGGCPINIPPRNSRKGRTETIIQTGQPIFIAKKKEWEEWHKQSERIENSGETFASWLGVPMKIGQKVLGVIATYHPTKDSVYSENDLEILHSMADLLVIVLENTRLFSEKEQQTKALEKANRRIAETQDVLTRSLIAADFVHRLNNLAGTIPIWVDMIRENIPKASLESINITTYLDHIDGDTNGLLRAAEQLTDAPRKLNIDMSFMLENILRQVRIQYRREIESKIIDVVKEIPSRLYFIWGNASSLSNAVYSVIANGIESILEKGQGVLTVYVQNWTDDNGQAWVKLDIADTGQGIVPDDQNKIFTPFFTTKGQGRGYGLWRSKTLIEEALRGHLTFTTEVGQGTTFTILLPEAM